MNRGFSKGLLAKVMVIMCIIGTGILLLDRMRHGELLGFDLPEYLVFIGALLIGILLTAASETFTYLVRDHRCSHKLVLAMEVITSIIMVGFILLICYIFRVFFYWWWL